MFSTNSSNSSLSVVFTIVSYIHVFKSVDHEYASWTINHKSCLFISQSAGIS